MYHNLTPLLFALTISFFSYGQLVCSDFTITGTTLEAYVPSQSTDCTISPLPIDSIYWTNSPMNGFPDGFIKYTFNSPQTSVLISYTVLNDDDIGEISINGGGVLSLNAVNGCVTTSGNTIGPYTGTGLFGDVQVSISSTQPFTEVTLTMISETSGIVSGDCSSVVINFNSCEVNIGNDTIICPSETLILVATKENATYLWQDNSTGSTFDVTQAGTYWVEVTIDSCIASDTIIVTMQDCEIAFGMPNVFSPNGDGVNDLFEPKLSKGIVSVNTVIYNRWGNKMFETNDPLIKWKAEDVSNGVYFWFVNYTDINGIENSLNGYVTVMR